MKRQWRYNPAHIIKEGAILTAPTTMIITIMKQIKFNLTTLLSKALSKIISILIVYILLWLCGLYRIEIGVAGAAEYKSPCWDNTITKHNDSYFLTAVTTTTPNTIPYRNANTISARPLITTCNATHHNMLYFVHPLANASTTAAQNGSESFTYYQLVGLILCFMLLLCLTTPYT